MSFKPVSFGALLLTGLLSACGGGGGGGSDSSTTTTTTTTPQPTTCGNPSPSTSTADFSLSTVNLTVNGAAGVATNPSQTVTMSVSNPAATTVVIQQTVSWLKIVSNLASGYATVSGDGSALVPGTYCTTVNVALLNASNTVLSTRDVAVKFVVDAAPALATAPAWTSYNGDLDPTAAGSLNLASGGTSMFAVTGTPFIDADGNTVTYADFMTPTGTGVLRLDSSASALQRSIVRRSYGGSAYPRYMTFLARVMPIAGTAYSANLRLWDLELSSGSSRVVFSLRGDAASNNVRLALFEEGGSDVNAQIDMSVPHIFQISVAMTSAKAGTVTVFADGNPTPIIGPLTTANMRSAAFPPNDEGVVFGDNRNLVMRSDLDWMAWTTQGAYMPSQLTGKLPSGLGVTTGY